MDGVIDRLFQVERNLGATNPAEGKKVSREHQNEVVRAVLRVDDAVHATQGDGLTRG